MNKKLVYGIIVVLFLSVLFIGGSVTTNDDVVADEEYDTSFYVEDSGNIFIKLAKVLDRCCYFTVDIVVSGVGNVFDVILGGWFEKKDSLYKESEIFFYEKVSFFLL